MMQKQRGLTLISWVIILVLVAIQAVFALRIIPVYMDFYSIRKIMDELPNDNELRGMSAQNMRGIINKRLQINNIYALQQDKDAFKFQNTGEGTIVSLYYEARGPIYGNLEFVATFDYEVAVPSK